VRITTLLLLALLPAPAEAAWAWLTAPGSRLEYNGYSVEAPSRRGWQYEEGGNFDVGFASLKSRSHTLGLTAAATPFRQIDDAQQLLAYVHEKLGGDADPARFTILEKIGRIGGGPAPICARTYYKAEELQAADRHGPSLMVLEASHLTCVHPRAPGIVVEVGYHQRYQPGQRAPEFTQIGEEFIASLRFGTARPDPATRLRFAAEFLERHERPQWAEPLIRDAIEQYRKNNDRHGLANAYEAYGDFFRSPSVSRQSVAIEYLDKAASLFMEQKRFDRLAEANLGIGIAYAEMKQIDAACSAFQRSLESSEADLRANPNRRQVLPLGFPTYREYLHYTGRRYGCPVA
jgi:tetratricopeptide (TPR) repeat protein